MFHQAAILGTKKVRLALATRKETDIPNEVIPLPDSTEIARAQLFVNLYGGTWELRKGHGGVYNCAGHVWASRRTAILEPAAIQLILGEDGYRLLSEDEPPLWGDLVVYWGKTNGEESWLHVGLVSEIRRSHEGERQVWVLSKFGSTVGEFLHNHRDVPYEQQGFSLRVEFYTDRG